MLHYRIHGFLLSELSVRKAGALKLQFLFEGAAIKIQHFANIWKVLLSPFSTH